MVMNKIRMFLEKLLEGYDKIFLLKISEDKIPILYEKFCDVTQNKFIEKKILFLFSKSIDIQKKTLDFIQISDTEIIEIQNLYFMYEFSNRFQIIEYNENVGTIWNFVNSGLLSEEDVIYALCY